MRATIGASATLLALAAASADAYWIKDCHYETVFASQTALVADLNPGLADAVSMLFGYSPRRQYLAAFGGALYFQADDGQHGAELWRVAGGAPALVADLRPGPQGSSPHAFALFQHQLYFAAATPATGEELFRYDGTSVALAAETTAGPDGGEITGLTAYDGALYFTRATAADGQQVWRFDGSTAAPVPAIDDIAGSVEDGDLIAAPFVVFSDRLYFVMDTPLPEKYELWAWDGAQVTKIKALTEGQNLVSYGFDLGVFQGALYFGVVAPADDPFEQDELWRYDGQGPPTKVATLPGHAFSFSQPGDFVAHQGKLYFGGGEELFRSDGSTVQALSAGPGGPPYYAEQLSPYPAADRLFLSGFHDTWVAREPYVFDGSSAYLVKDIMPDTASPYSGSFPSWAVEAAGALHFYAADDTHGRELWRTTGQEFPILRCYIVVAPIWDDWREWPVDRREVVLATWLLEPGAEPRLLARAGATAERGRELRARVLELDSRRSPIPEGFALATLVFDRATGAILDRGSDVVGSPAPRARAALERAAASLLKRRSLRAALAEPALAPER